MKRIDIFCASQASTSICMSMADQLPSSSSSSSSTISSSSSTIQLGGRAIDRHNPIIRDGTRRLTRVLPSAPCTSSSQPPPINPKPYHQLQKSSSTTTTTTNNKKTKKSTDKIQKRKSSVKQTDTIITKKLTATTDDQISSSISITDIKRQSCVKPPSGDLITPPGSTRYLLSDTGFLEGFSDYEPVSSTVVPVEPKKLISTPAANQTESISIASKPPLSSSRPEKPSSNQVVVLRVSLHCKGCEGKVRKHLSRMQGVTSYNIDFKEKKVTVVGDVTPLSVLASVSKVKNCQFWPMPAPTSPPSAAATDIKNKNKK